MSEPAPPADDAPRPSRARRLLRAVFEWAGTLALVAVVWVVVGRLRAPDLPDRAPDIRLASLDGGSVALSELRGRWVVLNFWAPWCPPCRVEIPGLSAFAEAHPEVAVLGIATDGEPEALRRAADELGIRYPVLLADRATVRAYGVDTLPTTVVVDPEGRVSAAHTGLLLRPQLELMVGD